MSYSNDTGRKQKIPTTRYLVALGSNQRHVRHGSPKNVLQAALLALKSENLAVEKHSTVISSRPIGPSQRQFANAAALVQTDLPPPALLENLKQVEEQFGPRRGQKWSQRVLDLDIILWSEGLFHAMIPALTIPHPLMRERGFVLRPAKQIAGKWRDPITGLTIVQLAFRLKRGKNRSSKG